MYLVQTQLMEYQPSCTGPTVSLRGQEGEITCWPAPTSTWPLVDGLGGVVPMLNSSFSVTTSALGRMVGGGHLVSG